MQSASQEVKEELETSEHVTPVLGEHVSRASHVQSTSQEVKEELETSEHVTPVQ